MHQIYIRSYNRRDAKSLVDIYYNTIHLINSRDYTKEQVNAWAPKSCLELDGWLKKWEKLKPIVATVEKKIVGFTEFKSDGYIDCFFCHHDWIGKGIGSVLMQAVEQKAIKQHITRIFANVSITAKPFFEYQGFNIIKTQMVVLNGVKFKNYRMEKLISFSCG